MWLTFAHLWSLQKMRKKSKTSFCCLVSKLQVLVCMVMKPFSALAQDLTEAVPRLEELRHSGLRVLWFDCATSLSGSQLQKRGGSWRLRVAAGGWREVWKLWDRWPTRQVQAVRGRLWGSSSGPSSLPPAQPEGHKPRCMLLQPCFPLNCWAVHP